MIKDSKDFIYIENKVDDTCYYYLLNTSRIITFKTVDYNTYSNYFSIEIILQGDSIELFYRQQKDMLEDIEQFKRILGFNNA